MNKNKYLLFVLTLFILFSNTVNASCTEEEVNRFKELESQFKVTHYIENNKYVLKIYNPDPDVFKYEIKTTNKLNCEIIDINNSKCIGEVNGEYNVSVKSYDSNCTTAFNQEPIIITKYNNFSESELCDGIENFTLCNPDYDKELTEEEFISRVKTYKKGLNKKNETKDDNSSDNNNNTNKTKITLINNIIKYIQDHLTTIIVISIFAILLIITIVLKIKAIRKSRYLE